MAGQAKSVTYDGSTRVPWPERCIPRLGIQQGGQLALEAGAVAYGPEDLCAVSFLKNSEGNHDDERM